MKHVRDCGFFFWSVTLFSGTVGAVDYGKIFNTSDFRSAYIFYHSVSKQLYVGILILSFSNQLFCSEDIEGNLIMVKIIC